MPLDKKSYFAALAVVSIELRAKCLKALKEILETNANGDLKQPKLKVAAPQVANR